jgi:hypothetical protein
MSPQPPRPCPHEQRPGTTVCLHCRRDARKAAHRRRQRIAIKAFVVIAVVSAGLATVGGLTIAIVRARPARMVALAGTAIESLRTRIRDMVSDTSSPSPVIETRRVAQEDAGRLLLPTVQVQVPPAPALPPTPPLLPIVAEGTTRLRDSVVAIRSGDSVTVRFDTRHARTRRPEKFEEIVRATLPAIYGPVVESALDRIPSGDLARAGNLLTDLPTRGLRLSLGDGWAVALWPATRPGQDGPLVVMYRAMVTRL